jgi:hypothetical protein
VLVAAGETEDEDVTWLRNDLASLRALCETNAGELSALREQVTMLEARQLSTEQLTAVLALLTPPPNSGEENSPPANSEENTGEDGQKDGPEGTNPADETPPAPAPEKRRRRFLQ